MELESPMTERKHTQDCLDILKENELLLAECDTLRKLLERGLAQMKAINGSVEECVIIESCKHHQWIKEVEALLKLAEEK